MPSYFRETRNVELSTIDFLETNINADWSGITTTKSFSSAYDLTLPVVCIRLQGTESDRLEVGSNTLYNVYNLLIDIFATSDGQRIDLADYIMNKLKDGWVYYTFGHAVGDNTTLTKTSAGRCRVIEWLDNSRTDLGDVEVENPDRFRHVISVRVRKSI